MMNADLKRKWLDALRSGKYQQAKAALHRQGDGFCCLGVLCDVSGLGKWEPVSTDTKLRARAYRIDGEPCIETCILPTAVRRAAGLDSCNPSVSVGPKYNEKASGFSLASLNDSLGFTFEQIADVIEAQL